MAHYLLREELDVLAQLALELGQTQVVAVHVALRQVGDGFVVDAHRAVAQLGCAERQSVVIVVVVARLSSQHDPGQARWGVRG